MKKQKHIFPQYSTRETLDGFKHEALGRGAKLTPEMITAVSGAMSKLIEDECNLIRAKADARLNAEQINYYKKGK